MIRFSAPDHESARRSIGHGVAAGAPPSTA